jgi:hypothetical protein
MTTIIDECSNIDYYKTIETNRLVLKGQKFARFADYILLFMFVSFGASAGFVLGKSLIHKNSTHLDYLMSVLLPLIVFLFIFFGVKNILTRDKLKVIEVSNNLENAKTILLNAAKNLGWRLDIITEKLMVFKTKFDFVNDSQTVTLIIFPDNKIYFNSMDYPRDYIRPSRFTDNFQALFNEYRKLEKLQKQTDK